MEMTMFARIGTTVAAALALAAGLSAAPAQAGLRQDFRLGFTTSAPSAPSGLSLHVLYRDAHGGDGKPPALTKLVVQLPAGTTFDTSVVPVCGASDTQLQTQGPGACPSGSRIGSGTFVGMTGFPGIDPLTADSVIFNGGTSLIEDVLAPGGQATAGVDRLHIQGSTLTANPPSTPGGPPDGRTVPRQVDVRVDPHGSFLMTPPACPADGRWLATSTASFADGGSETDASEIACSPAAQAAAPAHHTAARRRHGHRRARRR
jgi:hypothetical protein